MTIDQAIHRLVLKESLSRAEMSGAMTQIMNGQATTVQIAAFLVALRVKGETVDEISGATDAMRAAAVAVRVDCALVVDTCGTGGDGLGWFNVSTAAAFVVAGAGYTVAKHGNRSVTSRCGSADVLEALDIRIDPGLGIVERQLRQIGVAFLFAPAFHPATRHAMPVRRELGIRTIFNLLGPLTNPARPQVQLIGIYDPAWLKPVAESLIQTGTRDSVIVHSQGNDEISLSGPTQVVEVVEGSIHIDEWWPEDFGLKAQPGHHLKGGSPKENADTLLAVLKGESGPVRDTVCMNAAALIRAASRSRAGSGRALTLTQAFEVAARSIDSGAARRKLDDLRQLAVQPFSG